MSGATSRAEMSPSHGSESEIRPTKGLISAVAARANSDPAR